jgi:hypothetical protein
MHRLATLALSVALGLVAVAPACAQPAATANPSPDPAVTARAKAFYHALAAGSIDRSQLDAEANAKLTDETIKAVAAKLGPLGAPVTFEFVKSAPQGGSVLHAYLLSFGNGEKLEFVIGFDAQGKVSALAARSAP